VLVGLLVQGALLWWRSGLHGHVAMARLVLGSGVLLLVAGHWGPQALAPWSAKPWATLAFVTGLGALALCFFALWWRPWKVEQS
jgi:hypothetical protein